MCASLTQQKWLQILVLYVWQLMSIVFACACASDRMGFARCRRDKPAAAFDARDGQGSARHSQRFRLRFIPHNGLGYDISGTISLTTVEALHPSQWVRLLYIHHDS